MATLTLIMTNWIKNCFWSWTNVIYARLDYNDKIDYCIFWEELNLGWHQMQDEYLMSKEGFDPYNLMGRDTYYSYLMNK